ncbi:phage tail protein [Sediminibacterium ginsengisoli]|uniref:Microcystin-dependent protein n=1 Tax=Sediminibacterium ginsengisoli TaxID=413434 RepID=A0A1T4L5J9_9BACT|nr:tail fiber protein [Sediminibacterium ginsengisoli]SJZ50005.1 Microcystin-dependent protein [Sediminibacterium ginsengisoli]
MADPFYGEIRPFGFTYAPLDWLPCDGRQVPINQYQALFAIIGTSYGGNIQQGYFNLPNLQGAIATQLDTRQTPFDTLGETGGSATQGLLTNQMPNHNHSVKAVIGQGTTNAPGPTVSVAVPAATTGTTKSNIAAYSNTSSITMSAIEMGVVGTNTPHNNMGPFLVMNYCICVQNGIWPENPN